MKEPGVGRYNRFEDACSENPLLGRGRASSFHRRPELASCVVRGKGATRPKKTLMKSDRSPAGLTIFTIGHSTRPIDRFIQLLRANAVRQVIDIRTIPRSRHNPQFDSAALAASLRAARIRYVPLKELGGLRHTRPDSINLGWHNASFRGFADYMQTPAFEGALSRAIKWAKERPAVLMCAEALPWRCHRSLVADALTVRGIRVLEIVSDRPPAEHKITPFARFHGTSLTYPAEQASLA